MNTFNLDKNNSRININESISSLTINGSGNSIHLSAIISNLIINGCSNTIVSHGSELLIGNVIFNGNSNIIKTRNPDFNKISNGFNNFVNNHRVQNLLTQGNSFRFSGHPHSSNFNINITHSGSGFNSQVQDILNLVGFNPVNTEAMFFNPVYDDDQDDDEEGDEEYEEEEGCRDNYERQNELMEKRKEIILEFTEFQFKNADRYYKNKYVKRIESTCAICLEKFAPQDIVKEFSCEEHIFHKKCLEKWLKKSNLCPLCKYDLMSGQLREGEEFIFEPQN